ncbi:sulfite oxidase heme-binding subunit YedZ [Polynucleobacter sp. UK-Kesae-W10]|uniref:sulfite oxidase heme-binding subunit YedZ n=1 Tax=Polynucleobacter sp. UK-Kesae-W10 TaxID=1819738 RepID=UPI001C0B5868|nr:protein-methionine-sulfoxide reductase heme-binding subunit MsrQ [Polynucleobacter sp. UK-Kesae-W10]MBU3577003.1 sulfoxide reductase heme-binding subunit YedZ [Polynucleobacter sp. UK-Kesae-W10]
MRLLKSIVFLCCLLPLGRLVWLAYTDDLGANPIEFMTRSTGTWALVLLCITLAMTPMRLLTGSAVWVKLRRMLGLFCFFYAVLHFSIWFYLDQGLDVQAMVHDVLKRPFITMGFLSLVLLIPLALTSNQWSVRKLGRRWSILHKLVYVIAATVIIHYWWHKAGKNDVQIVMIYAAILILLLVTRMPLIRRHLQKSN